jgi:hypothetical protein
MEVACVGQSLLWNAECSMIFKSSVFFFWVSFRHLNHICVKNTKQKYSYVNVKLLCNDETVRN